jgi:uncharacterized protein (DUF1800 family)
MLVYLDNQANLKEAPNENYAQSRQLHTLGVAGAPSRMSWSWRCLTGWTVKRHPGPEVSFRR